MKCLAVREQIKAYTDGELGRVARWRMARHLARCVECQLEAKAMADLTEQVQNAGDIPAPEGLREKVLGKVEFKAVSAAGRKWPYVTKPVAAAGVLVFAVIVAAVFPMFQPASMTSPQQVKNEPAAKPAQVAKSVAAKQSVKHRTDHWAYDAVPEVRNQLTSPAPMIVKTGELTVLVQDYAKAGDTVVRMVKSAGGYVTDSSTISDSGSVTSGSMTLKVPVGRFEGLMEKLGALGKVKSKGITGEDVTGEVVDLESRLRNMRAEEMQYLSIMNKAVRVNDVVTVSRELYRVREEIETTVGRIKYLKTAADMSTIELTLTEKKNAAPQGTTMKSLTGAWASLLGTLSAIVSGVVWLLVYSPFWALPLVGVLYWRRKNRRVLSSVNEG